MSTFEEKETYKYLNTMKHAGKKEKRQKNTSGKTWKLLESKLPSRYLIKGMNTWAIPSLDTRDHS